MSQLDEDDQTVRGASLHHGSQTPLSSPLAELCVQCVLDVRVDGAGVSVLSADGTGVVVFASDPIASNIEDLQLILGEGPAVDAVASGVPVLVDDLSSSPGGADARWPFFRDEASRIGVCAVFAFPIRFGAIGVGTLDLVRQCPGPLDDRELDHALRTVHAVGEVLLNHESYPSGDPLAFRMTVHQAAGVVMAQLGSSIEDAMVRLRATAYAESISINDLASDVVRGLRRFTREDR